MAGIHPGDDLRGDEGVDQRLLYAVERALEGQQLARQARIDVRPARGERGIVREIQRRPQEIADQILRYGVIAPHAQGLVAEGLAPDREVPRIVRDRTGRLDEPVDPVAEPGGLLDELAVDRFQEAILRAQIDDDADVRSAGRLEKQVLQPVDGGALGLPVGLGRPVDEIVEESRHRIEGLGAEQQSIASAPTGLRRGSAEKIPRLRQTVGRHPGRKEVHVTAAVRAERIVHPVRRETVAVPGEHVLNAARARLVRSDMKDDPHLRPHGPALGDGAHLPGNAVQERQMTPKLLRGPVS